MSKKRSWCVVLSETLLTAIIGNDARDTTSSLRKPILLHLADSFRWQIDADVHSFEEGTIDNFASEWFILVKMVVIHVASSLYDF